MAISETKYNNSFQPTYNLNDIVFNQLTNKMLTTTQPNKDDSGITFNNTLIPPPQQQQQQASRKRNRDIINIVPIIPSVAPQLLDLNPIISNKRISRTNSSSSGTNALFLPHHHHQHHHQDLSLQIMEHQFEFDRLISHHMDKIRVEIEQKKKQQLKEIITSVEESITKKIREKEEELSKMGEINWTLQEKIKSLYLENQIWRDIAQTNEATANTLRANLAQALQQTNYFNNNNNLETADDAVSSCGEVEVEEVENAGDSKNGWIYRGNNNNNNSNSNNGNKRVCRKCGEGESSVLLLPCKHLCVCTVCGPMVNICPVCDTVKNASVHVNLS